MVKSVIPSLLLAAAAVAQIVPGRFVLELGGEPLGRHSRFGSGTQADSARRQRIQAEQRRVAEMVGQRGGRVLESLNAVMNALVVDAPGVDEGVFASVPGVARVYPVEEVRVNLDRALVLHSVPQAWSLAGGEARAGAGVKIGMLDTGITPEHPGFQAGDLSIPAGYPLFDQDANRPLVNNKIIVARSYERFYGGSEPGGARDYYGHGTATAMCAAGAPHQAPLAYISGMAPRAWIGVYKATRGRTLAARTDALAKALDDAVADGMDVINMSLGSALVLRMEKSLVAAAVDRAVAAGLIVVTSAGNEGPYPGSINSYGSIASAISVGNSDTDRDFGAGVFAREQPYRAVAVTSKAPTAAVSARVADVSRWNTTGSACNTLPAESVRGRIALVRNTSTCNTGQQLGYLKAAGAVAALFHPQSSGAAAYRADGGAAGLAAVMIGTNDAADLRLLLGASPDAIVKIAFEGVALPSGPVRLVTGSSHGPTYYGAIKPDLAATGIVYSATQSADPEGALFNAAGYAVLGGTSFSSPVVAGAAAVLKAARPGLTVDQYRSLLVNSADRLQLPSGPEGVQAVGGGILNLAGSLRSTIAAQPTSLSFATGPGKPGEFRRLTVTNLGTTARTFTLTAAPLGGTTGPSFSDGVSETDPKVVLSFGPAEAKVINLYWRSGNLSPGEYQGHIRIHDDQENLDAFVPYWYAAPAGAPAQAIAVTLPPSEMAAGSSVNVYLRVVDASSLPVLDRSALKYYGSAIEGGGAAGNLDFDADYPNTLRVSLKTGPKPGKNVFRISFADLPPLKFVVMATQP